MISCRPVKVPLPSDNVAVRDCRCGHDGSALITDVASVLACGNNEHNKLGLNERQGFLMAMKNIFNKVLLQSTLPSNRQHVSVRKNVFKMIYFVLSGT